VGGLSFASSAALAAAPEAPSAVTVESVTASSAMLRGVLNPGKEGTPGTYEVGTYEFLYKQSGTDCEGGASAPESPGISLGEGKEEVPSPEGSVEVTGLLPGREYTVCLLARSGIKGEATVGPAVTFKTATPPETPLTTQPATGVTATSATLHGVLNPGQEGEAGGYEFLYRVSATECQGGEASGGNALGHEVEAVSAEVSGLQPSSQYTFCLLARNDAGETALGSPVTFTTPAKAPTVEGEAFSQVGPTSASITAQLNTENLPASYSFEYTPKGGQPKRTAEAMLPASNSPVPVEAQLTGLTPGSEYTFRLIATNTAKETTEGTPTLFTTLPEPITGLPDNRVYEMVTPTQNQDANVYIPLALAENLSQGIRTRFPFQVATDGSAVAYIADPTTVGFGQSGRGLGNQYLATRASAGGWTQNLLQPPGRKKTNYQGFSEDLSVGILNSGNGNEPKVPALTAEAADEGYSVLYACSDSKTPCNVSEPGVMEAVNPYKPLFITRPLNRTAREFRAQKTYSAGQEELVPAFAGGSAGFVETLFEANDALLPGEGLLEGELNKDVKQEISEGKNNNYLYASVGGHLSLVDVSPGGQVVQDASFRSTPFTNPGDNPADFSGVISDDGERVYWSNGASEVFVRVGGVSTVPVSAGVARYWTSAEEGRFAFYTKNGGLYRFDIDRAASEARELLVAESASVLGVVGVSEDGEDVYFVAEGVMGLGANGEGAAPEAGQPNLYLERHGQAPVFIATLSPEDGKEVNPFIRSLGAGIGEYGDWQPGLGQRTARVTGRGNSVVFMSSLRLKAVGFPEGYENDGLDEVYSYQAESNQLFCVSCSTSGERPESNLETEEGHVAAFLPISWSDTYLPQWVSDGGGRVFFDSAVPLVPRDTNGRQDVYEWERAGVGSCSGGLAVDGGCVFLLSGGTSSADSWFIGASVNGDDVFVATRAQLSSLDGNDAFDLYDARVGGEVPVSPPACSGTGCQGVPAPPPSFATPSTATFQGVGNFPPPIPPKPKPKAKAKGLSRAEKLARALKTCRKVRTGKRASCEASARKRYGTKPKARGKKSTSEGGRHV
jgi:hypothetical protein